MLHWKDIKLGKKIMAAVGIVIIALAFVSIFVVRGITSIVRYGLEVSAGNKLRGELLQREVDHLKWTQELGRYVYDDRAKDLKVQLDPTQCGFGKWYYGSGRKEAEALLPSLHQSLQEIEEPHRRLHESAAHIRDLRTQGRGNEIHAAYESVTMVQLGVVQGLLKGMAGMAKESILSEEGMVSNALRMRMVTIMVAVIAIFAGILLSWWVTRTVVRPINKSVAFAESVASGDFRTHLDIRQKDEMGSLAAALCHGGEAAAGHYGCAIRRRQCCLREPAAVRGIGAIVPGHDGAGGLSRGSLVVGGGNERHDQAEC